MPGFNRVLAAALASAAFAFCAACPASRAQSSFSFDTTGDAAPDVPGAPRTRILIYRRLLEDGYELSAPIVRNGPVDIANVRDRQSHPLCMVLDSFTGTILQTFAYTAQGLSALNADAPGPGFPGYPPYPDARYASACYQGRPAPVITPPRKIIIRPLPKPHFLAHIHRRAIVRRPIKPACGPAQPSAEQPSASQPPLRPHDTVQNLGPTSPGVCVRPQS